MAINTQDFTTLVRNMVAAIQGQSKKLVDLTIGSILRAFVESVAAVAMWLQGLILNVLSMTRAATSTGADLDSWMADFFFYRIAAVAATGNVTFSRFTATGQALVPVGTLVQTGDGSVKFNVVVDTGNPAYSSTLNAYVMADGTYSVTVPVQAQTAGLSGNVSANQINTIAQALTGVDTVTNASGFTNGADAETDTAFRARFELYIASLSKAIKSAIEYAISQVPGVADYKLVENQDYNGNDHPGYFYAIIDDGTGVPSGGLLANVSSAIDAVRGFTINFGVFSPVVLSTNVSMTITAASGYVGATVKANVQAAITSYLNSLKLGEDFQYTRLAQIAYGVEGVANATSILLNGGTSDISVSDKQVIKAGTITIS